MTTVVPSFIPVAIMARQRRIIRRFRDAGADEAMRARTPAELGVRDKHLFGRLVAAGVLVAADDSRYFLCIEGLARWHRRRRIAVAMATAIAVVGSLVAWGVANW